MAGGQWTQWTGTVDAVGENREGFFLSRRHGGTEWKPPIRLALYSSVPLCLREKFGVQGSKFRVRIAVGRTERARFGRNPSARGAPKSGSRPRAAMEYGKRGEESRPAQHIPGRVQHRGVAVDVVAVALEDGWPVASRRCDGKPGGVLSLTEPRGHGVEYPDSAGSLLLRASVPP